MEYEQVRALAVDVVDAARPALTPREAESLDGLIGQAEPGLAAKFALDLAVQGRWMVPERLVDRLREWAASVPRERYRRSIERALAASALVGTA